jgi:hypothetical protein
MSDFFIQHKRGNVDFAKLDWKKSDLQLALLTGKSRNYIGEMRRKLRKPKVNTDTHKQFGRLKGMQ